MPAYNRFDKKEDEKLKKLVETFGTNNWKLISGKMYGRTARQCKDRYTRFLVPGINRSEWTNEEDNLLLFLAENMNHKWRQISSNFNNRNEVQCRNRYLHLMNIINKTITSSPNTEYSTSSSIENSCSMELIDFDFEFDDTFSVFEA